MKVCIQIKISVYEIFQNHLPGKLLLSKIFLDLVGRQLIAFQEIARECLIKFPFYIRCIIDRRITVSCYQDPPFNGSLIPTAAGKFSLIQIFIRERRIADFQLFLTVRTYKIRQCANRNALALPVRLSCLLKLPDFFRNQFFCPLDSYLFCRKFTGFFLQHMNVLLHSLRLHPVGCPPQVHDILDFLQMKAHRFQFLNILEVLRFSGRKIIL